MEKTINACVELKERLMNIKREKRNKIIIVITYCFIAGIVMSQFLLIGATFWMFMGLIFISALFIHYNTKEAQVIREIEKLGNCEY